MSELRALVAELFAGEYEVGEELGGGGMSRLFLARDIALKRQVVIKILPPDLTSEVTAAPQRHRHRHRHDPFASGDVVNLSTVDTFNYQSYRTTNALSFSGGDIRSGTAVGPKLIDIGTHLR